MIGARVTNNILQNKFDSTKLNELSQTGVRDNQTGFAAIRQINMCMHIFIDCMNWWIQSYYLYHLDQDLFLQMISLKNQDFWCFYNKQDNAREKRFCLVCDFQCFDLFCFIIKEFDNKKLLDKIVDDK